MQTIVQVRNLSKRYQLRKPRNINSTLREALVGLFKSPLDRLSGRNGSRNDLLWALRDVSFDVAPGDVVGIIGPNGAGKSTLLKILSRITKPSEGEVDIYGRVGSLLEIGTGFHPDLTGRENIFLNAAILGMKRAETRRKFDEMVDFSEIERFLDVPVKFYSLGMYVRLAFAIAVHLEPEVLILDEVLAVGDANFQKKCFEKMRQVHCEGRTVLLVSHNMASIKDFCNRVFVVNGGQLTEGADPLATIAKYVADSPQNQNFEIRENDTNSAENHLAVPAKIGSA
jgi:lipopolysaccharide transport system ATP-binding protein